MALKSRQVAALKTKQPLSLGQPELAGPPLAAPPLTAPAVAPLPTQAIPARNDLPQRGRRMGARDGLGRGKGGLAIHSSLAGHNIEGYEPAHSSKIR